MGVFFIFSVSGREAGLSLHLWAGATNGTVINASKSRIPQSLQAEHFAPGQTLWIGSFHLLYSSELQSSHSAPSPAFNLQIDPVLFQQSTALTFLFSQGHRDHQLLPINLSTSPDDSLRDRAAQSSRTSSDTNLLFGECQVVAIPKGFLEVER